MEIFVIVLRIFLMLSQIDCSLFDSVMKIFYMLSKIYNPLETPCLSSLCCRSESEKVFMNSILLTCRQKYVSWQGSWIEFKNTSSNTTLEYFAVYVCFKLLTCFFMHLLIIFYVIFHEISLKLQKGIMVLFELYNPECFCHFRII